MIANLALPLLVTCRKLSAKYAIGWPPVAKQPLYRLLKHHSTMKSISKSGRLNIGAVDSACLSFWNAARVNSLHWKEFFLSRLVKEIHEVRLLTEVEASGKIHLCIPLYCWMGITSYGVILVGWWNRLCITSSVDLPIIEATALLDSLPSVASFAPISNTENCSWLGQFCRLDVPSLQVSSPLGIL